MTSRLHTVAVTLIVLVALLCAAMPWLKTPVLLALSNGLAVLGVIVLIRAGQVSFGHAMYACLSGYTVAFVGRAWHLDALLQRADGQVLPPPDAASRQRFGGPRSAAGGASAQPASTV